MAVMVKRLLPYIHPIPVGAVVAEVVAEDMGGKGVKVVMEPKIIMELGVKAVISGGI